MCLCQQMALETHSQIMLAQQELRSIPLSFSAPFAMELWFLPVFNSQIRSNYIQKSFSVWITKTGSPSMCQVGHIHGFKFKFLLVVDC